MELKDIISLQDIIPDLNATTRTEALTEMAKKLSENYPELDLSTVINLLIEREKLGTTAKGWFAMPHCRYPNITRIYGVIGRSFEGVDYEDEKGNNDVKLLIMLIIPDQSPNEYLKILAQIITRLRQDWFEDSIKRLPKNVDQEILYRLITDV